MYQKFGLVHVTQCHSKSTSSLKCDKVLNTYDTYVDREGPLALLDSSGGGVVNNEYLAESRLIGCCRAPCRHCKLGTLRKQRVCFHTSSCKSRSRDYLEIAQARALA